MVPTLALTILAAASVATAPGAASTPGTITVVPSSLEVRTFFSGASLRIVGTAPATDKLAVVLEGARKDVDLKRKGKVWGLLWMNVGEISFPDVPSVYMIASSGPICDLAPYETRVRLGLGTDVLGARFAAKHADPDAARLFGELVKLKKQEGLYATAEGALDLEPVPGGGVKFSTELALPANVPEGTYSLVLRGFRDGVEETLAGTEVTVAEAGVTRDIAHFARTHGLLYGVLAVIIALVVGSLTGVVFGMVGKGGH